MVRIGRVKNEKLSRAMRGEVTNRSRCARCHGFCKNGQALCIKCFEPVSIAPPIDTPIEDVQEDMDVLLGLVKPQSEEPDFDMAEALRILQSKD